MRSHGSQRIAAIGVVCILGLVVIGMILGAEMAVGQDQPRAPVVREGGDVVVPGAAEEPAKRDAGPRAGVGDEGRRRFDQERAQRFAAEMSMARQAPAIAVAEGKVYVVLNGMLYKFDAETLAVEGQQRIPRPEPPAGAFRGRTGRGDRPQGEGRRGGDQN